MHGFSVIFLIITLVIIGSAGVGGYTLYQKQQKPAEVSQPTVSPTPTPTPSLSPSPKPTAVQTSQNSWVSPTVSIDMNTQSNIKLESVSPNPAINSQQITLRGKNFGSSQGYVVFYNEYGSVSGSPSIHKWTDQEIITWVTFVRKGSFYLEVKTSEEKRSNKIPFTVSAGQPIIDSLSTTNFKKGSTVVIVGTEFGSTVGKVNFFKGMGNILGYGIIGSWNDTQIIFTVPPTIESGNLDIQVITSDNRESSSKYINVTE